jgi:hypothetical protein
MLKYFMVFKGAILFRSPKPYFTLQSNFTVIAYGYFFKGKF